jgi:F-type H+-transporting ATPase subunit epsilon
LTPKRQNARLKGARNRRNFHVAGSFKFELVTPERVAASHDVEQVLVPGSEGDFTVLVGHAPLIATLRPGVVEITRAGAGKERVFVKGGFAEVDADRLTILAERAIEVDALDPATIAAELEVAEAELAEAKDDAGKRAASFAVESLKALRS